MNSFGLTYCQSTSNATLNGAFVVFDFAGKERDEETGYGYFGARRYDADLQSGWSSIDPMSDKYSSISPYAYCAWNPVKLVDLDGSIIKTYDKATQQMVSTYMYELFGDFNPFRFDRYGNLSINQRNYKLFFHTATSDQKQLLEGFNAAINAKKVAYVKVQTENSNFVFYYNLNEEEYSEVVFSNPVESGCTSTTPMPGILNIYPIAINDKGENQRNNLTATDQDGNSTYTSSTASTVFCHELLDEFLNVVVLEKILPSSPNIEKVIFQNCGQRIKGLLERNGADHDY